MRIQSGPQYILRRYLTPFHRFALGLAFLVVLTACDTQAVTTPNASTATQRAVLTQAILPTQTNTPVHSMSKPTVLPEIPPTPDERTPSPLGVTASQLRGEEVSLWYPWIGTQAVAFQAIVEQFNRTNQWGISVQAGSYEGFGALDEAVESALTSAALPDVLVDYGYQATHWDGNGVLMDLTAYVNDPVWGFSSGEQADFYPVFWAEDLGRSDETSNPGRLGIPYYRSSYMLFYNQSWAKELGFANPPKTPDEFKLQACTAAVARGALGDKSDISRGGWLISPQPGALVGWIYAFGGGITNPDRLGYLFNTPETRQAFEYLKGLLESGCAWSESGVNPQSEFASRRAMFIVGSLYDIPSQSEALAQAGSSDEWTVIPFPSTRHPVIDTYGPSLFITQSTPAEQLAAWLVVKWLVYPPTLAVWVNEMGAYPARQSVLYSLSEAESHNPQWAEALELLPEARSEPTLASWSVVRWSLNDVITALVNPQTTSEQIPALLENLDSVASEIYHQVR